MLGLSEAFPGISQLMLFLSRIHSVIPLLFFPHFRDHTISERGKVIISHQVRMNILIIPGSLSLLEEDHHHRTFGRLALPFSRFFAILFPSRSPVSYFALFTGDNPWDLGKSVSGLAHMFTIANLSSVTVIVMLYVVQHPSHCLTNSPPILQRRNFATFPLVLCPDISHIFTGRIVSKYQGEKNSEENWQHMTFCLTLHGRKLRLRRSIITFVRYATVQPHSLGSEITRGVPGCETGSKPDCLRRFKAGKLPPTTILLK